MVEILKFLSDLSRNNNREWFAENKQRYLQCQERFLDFSEQYITRLQAIDPTLKGLQVKDCVWRIYRDTRFSKDKTPYKIHFGVFPAMKGGRHSQRGGYYVHIQPEHCMFAGGIWNPGKELLRALRNEIMVNYEEVEAIFAREDTSRYFRDFDTEWMLQRVPQGFPADFRHADWLKRQAYTFSTPLTDKQVCAPDFLDQVLKIASAAKPLNDFLNYTFEEYGEFPSRT